jgi:Mrp family chromosome partitioning ATPase
MLTLRTNDFRHVLLELVEHVQESGARLVRIEGVMGAGKSTLADMLAAALRDANVVHVDREFASPDESYCPYAEAIDISALHARLGSLLQEPRLTILDAVCLGEVAPEATFGRGFVIYVKRVAVLGADLHLWHGFDEGAALPENLLFRSIHCYHMRFRPHEKADILLVHPEELHSFGDRAPRA